MKISETAQIPQREWITVSGDLDSSKKLQEISIEVFGCHNLVEAGKKLQDMLQKQAVDSIQWPGSEHWDNLIREVLLRLNQNFKLPYQEEELCHCRTIPTTVVDQAIVLGAQDPDQVKSWTSAGSGCGTCRADVQSIIDYRKSK